MCTYTAQQTCQYHLFSTAITKTCLYNCDPLKPHFYIIKLGFTGVYLIFLISAQNIDCGYSLEPPRRGGSNEYPQSMFWAEIWKISEFFILKFSFFDGKIFTIFELACFRNDTIEISQTIHGEREEPEQTVGVNSQIWARLFKALLA